MFFKSVRGFFQLESAGGIVLVVAAVLAMAVNNSPLSSLYGVFLNVPLEIRIGPLKIAKPLLLWVNDGLMAVFFLLIGLEVKREIVEGQLSSLAKAALPGIAAVGGMVVPAFIYVVSNWGDPVALNGWAIPAATDIAFSLGILALLGKRVPPGLKMFLLAVAIMDDLGAIIIIALFYSGSLSVLSLVLAAGVLVVLALLNRSGVTSIAPYVMLGVILWVCVLKSGVHATLAGVALAFFIPLKSVGQEGRSPARELEEALHPWVVFGIMPLFAFANSGVSLSGMTLRTLFSPVPMGIAAGLFFGKQIGIFGFSWTAVKLKLASLPEGVNWPEFYGLSVLCGIGFTMSLFIGSLAFEMAGPDFETSVRLGVLVGTLLSGVAGYALLAAALKAR